MDKLTLDTNVMRDWAWCDGRSKETRYNDDPGRLRELKSQFDALKSLRDQGECELGVTNQLLTDYQSESGELPEHIKEMIGPYVSIASPRISTFPLMFPLAFVDRKQINDILQCVFPGSQPRHAKYSKNRKDALQLYAHRVARRDYFITSDGQILAAHDVLSAKWNIQTATLAQYLSMKQSSSRATDPT